MQQFKIFGPPGTGKTTTLLNKVEDMQAIGIAPDRIGFVSFTKKAAAEAKDRAAIKFERPHKDFKWFRTLHSLCFQALQLDKTRVMDKRHTDEFAAYAKIKLSGNISYEEGGTFGGEQGDRILFMENLARINRISLKQQYDYYNDNLPWVEVARVEGCYKKFKQHHDLLDYTDMLAEFVSTGTAPRLETLIVDEAQDQSLLQWQVVAKLSSQCSQLYVAGDDDQAIYTWAGADVSSFLNCPGTVTVLDRSFRVPSAIMPLAQGIARSIAERKDKRWRSAEHAGSLEWGQRVDWLRDVDTLVLARNKKFLDRAASQLYTDGILYETKYGWSISEKLIHAITDWTELSRGRSISYERAKTLYEFLSSGTRIKRGHKSLQGVPDDRPIDFDLLQSQGGLLAAQQMHWFHALDTNIEPKEIEYVRRIIRRHGGKFPERCAIRLSTIHSIKGGEADRVILLPDMVPRTYEEMSKFPDHEKRVWYVAVTRARKELNILEPTTDLSMPLRRYVQQPGSQLNG